MRSQDRTGRTCGRCKSEDVLYRSRKHAAAAGAGSLVRQGGGTEGRRRGMSERPVTWHYGLVARWWAEFNHGGPEIEYLRSILEADGQPALDVACGAGRVLLPLARAGLDVDGCD